MSTRLTCPKAGCGASWVVSEETAEWRCPRCGGVVAEAVPMAVPVATPPVAIAIPTASPVSPSAVPAPEGALKDPEPRPSKKRRKKPQAERLPTVYIFGREVNWIVLGGAGLGCLVLLILLLGWSGIFDSSSHPSAPVAAEIERGMTVQQVENIVGSLRSGRIEVSALQKAKAEVKTGRSNADAIEAGFFTWEGRDPNTGRVTITFEEGKVAGIRR